MKNSSRILLGCCLLAFSALSLGAPNTLSKPSANNAHVLTGMPDKIRVMVHFTPQRAEQALETLTQVGGQIHHRFDDLGVIAVSVPKAAIPGLEHNPNIILIEEDFKRYPSTQTVPYGIDAVQARDVWDADNDGTADSGAPNGSNILVCVIDSGLQTSHADMNGVNTVGGYPAGWSTDTCGHGTHVAGTITAANNTAGVVGVNPGSTSLYIVKVFDGQSCGWAYSSSLIDASNHCRDAGADIINMSLGGSGRSRAEDKAFKALYNKEGILSVAAAGNDGNTRKSYPASYDSVVSVAAVDVNNVVADFSQQNSAVELAAPGVDVLSTVPWLATNTLTADGATYNGGQIENAALGTVTGNLINGGLCDSSGDWENLVVLCERGNISFFEKVSNVTSGGGIAAVIYNNEAGGFSGTLGDGNTSSIPAIALSQESGQTISQAIVIANVEGSVVSAFDTSGSGYEYWSGTSMATPHVSGVAALVWSSDLTKTNTDIRDALAQNTVDLGDSGRDTAYGYGLVQAYSAWSSLGGSSGSNNQAPTASFTASCNELDCAFDGNASGDPEDGLLTYVWDFGDNATGTGATHNNAYASSGTYTVSLTVTDDAGATNTQTKNITVSDGSTATTLLISDVSAAKTKGTSFAISWATNLAADSTITFACCGDFSNADLVTSHSMTFRGSKGASYEYWVHSRTESGETTSEGSFNFQN